MASTIGAPVSTPPSFFRRRRRLLIALGAAALILVLIALGAYLYVHGHEPGEVHNSTVEFQSEQPEQAVKPRRGRAFVWADYGYTKDRRRYLPANADLRPPFKTVWTLSTRELVEFPPVLAGRRLFLLKNNGTLWAIGANNGHRVWQQKVGAQAAASPTVANGVVYAVVLKRLHRVPKGRVAAYTQRRGRVLWSRPLHARSESSPVYANGMLFFGSEDGTVYALDASNGHVRWTYRAPGAVKSGLALNDGILYFGDYSGHVQAVRASNGHKVWSAKTEGAKFGFASGQFYSTPAVAFGRVYLGNTDGFVYSFATTNGKLAWSKRTSNYVYASPAVADIPHFGPTVYIGSYDGTFYALNARSGSVRWQRKAGGKISGSATIVGNIVYFANLAARTTIGLAVRSGNVVFRFPHGGFNPVISDGQRLYLEGYSSLYGLIPKTAAERAAAGRRVREQRRQERSRKRHERRQKRH